MALRITREVVSRLWTRSKWKAIAVFALLLALFLGPLRAGAQFGLDPCCAIISAGLSTISSLLQNSVAKPLARIQQLQQQAADFEQQVVFPLDTIKNARASALQLETQLRQISQLTRLPISSATLPAAQQLEQVLLSRNPQSLPLVSQNYTALYGAVMSAADAPQPVRDLVDMTDAEAQAAFKKAVELDALADIEMSVADEINQQLQSAAPGSAPILEAQAAAWLVKANASTQSAMAELLRLHSIDIAASAAQLKFNSGDANSLRTNATQVLQR